MDKEHVKGAADKAKGAVKDAAGKMMGDKELQAGQVAVRTRTGEDLGAMPLESFIDRLQQETASRR